MKIWRKALFLIVLSIFIFTCNIGKEGEKRQSGTNAAPIVAGNDVDPSAHFQLTPETVVIRKGAQVVRKISPDHSTFTLDGSVASVQNLALGKVMLIAGIDVGKVTAVRKEGKDVIVTVGPVKITDVIRNGTIRWAPKDIDFNRGTWMSTEAGAIQSSISEPPGAFPHFTPQGIFEQGAEAAQPGYQQKVKLTVGVWKVELTFQQGTFTLYSARQTSPLWIGITVKLKMGEPQTSGQIVVQQGRITNVEMDTPADGYVDLDVTSQTDQTPAFPGKAVIELPVEWIIPIETPGLPLYIGLKANFLAQPEIPTKKTAVGIKLHSDFHGNMGFDYGGGSLVKKTNVQFESNPPEITGTPSVGVIAVLFAVQIPRIAVGLGARSLVSGGAFMDVVHAVTVTIASATSMFPCKQMTFTQTASAGFEYEVGPDIFQALVKKLTNARFKGEFHKIELQKKERSWYDPPIKACKQ